MHNPVLLHRDSQRQDHQGNLQFNQLDCQHLNLLNSLYPALLSSLQSAQHFNRLHSLRRRQPHSLLISRREFHQYSLRHILPVSRQELQHLNLRCNHRVYQQSNQHLSHRGSLPISRHRSPPNNRHLSLLLSQHASLVAILHVNLQNSQVPSLLNSRQDSRRLFRVGSLRRNQRVNPR